MTPAFIPVQHLECLGKGFRQHAATFCIVFILGIAVLITGCADRVTRPQGGSRDHLLGWYKLPGRNERMENISGQDTLIPVFKRAGVYYSVCRGFEVPFKECPEGLEWSLTPSNMEGTRIGLEAASRTHYLAVTDACASNSTDGGHGNGEREPMTRIGKPWGLLKAQARQPRIHDDLLGWYQPLWFPGVRIEIRKDGEDYFSQEQGFHGPGSHSWKSPAKPQKLRVMADRLGLIYERDRNVQLVYNDLLKRFEVVKLRTGHAPSAVRMPLARVRAPSSPEAGATPSPTARLGIPAWH